jgi:hypothetical protein
MTDFPGLLRALQREKVRFIVIGGAASTAHGSARLTLDLDVAYSRTPENLRRLAMAIAPLAPALRGAPEGLPFVWNERTIRSGLNFTLSTSLGAINLLGEVAGGGRYENLEKDTETIHVFGVDCLFVNLDALIRLKRAAGRRKDLEAIAELEAIREEREKTGLR